MFGKREKMEREEKKERRPKERKRGQRIIEKRKVEMEEEPFIVSK